MNSNAYICAQSVGKKFYGFDCKNITIEAMNHALGMILKMSFVSIHLGGLKAYFNPISKIYIACDQASDMKTIETNWTNEHLTYKCFLQMRATLHPEDQELDTGD